MFRLLTTSRPALEPTHLLIQWVQWYAPQRVKWPGGEANSSPQYSAEVKNGETILPLPTCLHVVVFTYVVKFRANCVVHLSLHSRNKKPLRAQIMGTTNKPVTSAIFDCVPKTTLQGSSLNYVCLQTRKRNGKIAVNLKCVVHFPIQGLLEAFLLSINTELDMCVKMHAGLHISVIFIRL
jgi:hypothetical protein